MAVSLAQFFFGISLAGILFLVFRKIPELSSLGEEAQEPGMAEKAKRGLAGFMRRFSFYLFLENLLSRARSLISKSEEKVTGWSEQVKRKNGSSQKYRDSYWDKLKRN